MESFWVGDLRGTVQIFSVGRIHSDHVELTGHRCIRHAGHRFELWRLRLVGFLERTGRRKLPGLTAHPELIHCSWLGSSDDPDQTYLYHRVLALIR